MTYTVGEMAERLGVTPSTLRYYDREGMLPFVERTASGARLFKDEDLGWFRIIECLKKTGMPIKDIKRFIDLCIEGDSAIDERLELITERLAAVQSQIDELAQARDLLEYKRWYYQVAKEAGTCAVHDEIAPADIPKRFRPFVAGCDAEDRNAAESPAEASFRA